MSTWLKLENEDELSEKIRFLKKNAIGKFYSNYQLIGGNNNSVLPQGEVFFSEEGLNITLLKRFDDVYKLYYLIGDLESFSLALPELVKPCDVVCEIVEKEGKERQSEVVARLENFGFCYYKKHFLWELKSTEDAAVKSSVLTFEESADPTRLSDIYTIFDCYSDQLPLKEAFEKYCSEEGTLIAFDNGTYVGGAIYTLSGNVATEEYVYTIPEMRGRGYSTQIEKRLVEDCFNKHNVKKICAWIERDNASSLALHTSFGYQRASQYKLTLKIN